MVRQCRAQMPLLRPEPFYVGPDLGDAVGVNVDAVAAATGDEGSYNQAHSQAYSSHYSHQNPSYNGYSSHNAFNPGYNTLVPPPMVSKPLRRRPPAHIYVGRPLRPGTSVTVLWAAADLRPSAPSEAVAVRQTKCRVACVEDATWETRTAGMREAAAILLLELGCSSYQSFGKKTRVL